MEASLYLGMLALRNLPNVSSQRRRVGRIDTPINNAGIFIAKPFTQYTGADYAAILDVNLSGFFHMTQLAIAEMEKRGSVISCK
jgi:NAD(P)-dependent dehydrogenase (short-subunit alcohol dehydrogenase family)